MLLNHQRRLLVTLCRRTISSHIPSIYYRSSFNNTQVRHVQSDAPIKRKILLKINTGFSESFDGSSSDSDTANITCLSNELVLSERMVKFPFHYRCLVEQQLAVCQDRPVSNDEWQELYNIVGETTKPLFASITMLVCVQLEHIQRGRSLFEFIQQHYPQLIASTATTYTAYMNLLALNFFAMEGKKHQKDYSSYANEICDIYQTYVKDRKQLTLASKSALGIIKGLCVTPLWHEGFVYLPFTNDDDQLTAMVEMTLAALHNNDLTNAIKLINNLKLTPPNDSAAATMSSFLNDMVQQMFINLNVNDEHAYDFIQSLFHYVSTLDCFIEKSAVNEIQRFFAKLKPNIFEWGTTMIKPSGACKQLPGLNLSTGDVKDADFKFLINYLVETAYADKEVYNTTTPAEFKRLKQVLSRSKFTMVVDGLNVLYGVDRFATDPISSMTKTINLLKNLRLPRRQMLFIARKHVLSRIPQSLQDDLQSLCEVFLVDNTSRDDWFVLYSALSSRAYVLTSDILRKERGITNKSTPAKNAEVNDKLQKWLYRYQYMFIRQGNRAFFKPPMAYALKAQYTQNVWLIPYFNSKPQTLAERPENWFYVYKISDVKQQGSIKWDTENILITEQKKAS